MRWFCVWLAVVVCPFARGEGGIDNSSLIPRLLPDSGVKLEGGTPDWVKSLVMVQFRIETATPEGTFGSAVRVLDHYARMGVNGLWINPIQERGSKSNGYINFGPHGVEPLLAGTDGAGEPLDEVRKFVEEAHRRHLRVFFDIIVWGTAKDAPLVKERPEFYERQGDGLREIWGGYAFDWGNGDFRSWFEDVAVAFIEKTGADGFRVDLAPDLSGYFFERVRERLYRKGRKIVLISEMPNERREVFDFEQTGVTGWTETPDWGNPDRLREQRRRFGLPHEYFFSHNLVDAIRSGRGIGSAPMQQRGEGGSFRFYTANLLCHDDHRPAAKGSRVRLAYGTLFTPFLPMWWIGEEWNNPANPLPDPRGTGVMYFNTIDWEEARKEPNVLFLEDIKAYLRIRRSHPEIFENFPARARDAAIAKVDSRADGAGNPLQAYARYHGGKAILVVPNTAERTVTMEVDLDCSAWGVETGGRAILRVTDLMRGELVASGAPGELRSFTREVEGERLGVFLVEADG